jgi:hypothetical protein
LYRLLVSEFIEKRSEFESTKDKFYKAVTNHLKVLTAHQIEAVPGVRMCFSILQQVGQSQAKANTVVRPLSTTPGQPDGDRF